MKNKKDCRKKADAERAYEIFCGIWMLVYISIVTTGILIGAINLMLGG